MIGMVPIGHVKSGFREPSELERACKEGKAFSAISEIVLRPGSSEMLQGLEQSSHIWVIFHLHKAGRVEPVTYPGPKSVKRLPKVGVFASRSQYRPNHIALRLVSFMSRRGNVLKVKGLDAINGTPVLDLKPYVPLFDLPENPKTAAWYEGW